MAKLSSPNQKEGANDMAYNNRKDAKTRESILVDANLNPILVRRSTSPDNSPAPTLREGQLLFESLPDESPEPTDPARQSIFAIQDLKELSEDDYPSALQDVVNLRADYSEVVGTHNNLLHILAQYHDRAQHHISQLETELSKTTTSYQAKRKKLEQQLGSLQGQLDDEETRVKELEQELHEVKAQTAQSVKIPDPTATPPPPVVMEGVKVRQSEKLPDVAHYYGTPNSSSELDHWMVDIDTKLTGNADRYPTETDRVRYASTRLAGTAKDLLLHRLKRGTTEPFVDLDDLFAALDTHHGDPDRRATAKRAMKNLFQNFTPFQEFWTTFYKLSVILKWDHDEIISTCRDRLNTHMEKGLVGWKSPSSLKEFVDHCIMVERQCKDFESNHKQPLADKSWASGPPKKFTPRANAGNAPAPSTPLKKYDGAILVDHLQKKRACFNCGDPSHFAKDCKLPPREPNKQLGPQAKHVAAMELMALETPSAPSPPSSPKN